MGDTEMYKGYKIRTGPGIDRDMIRDSLKHYSHFSLDKKSVVLDLGSNIGGFTRMANEKEVKQYIAVEPDPENMELTTVNSIDGSNNLYLLGVASISESEHLTFFQSNAVRSKCSGTINSKSQTATRKNGTAYDVVNYNVYELLEKYKPTHVKCDIEGAEIDWLADCEGIFPDYIQELAFELHGRAGIVELERYYDNIIEHFEIVSFVPSVGFKGSFNKKDAVLYEKVGYTTEGTLWSIDLFLRRRVK
jgi:FkbM family methyltransferase